MSGTRVASVMNSTTSITWVQLASLLSRTPSCAEMVRPLPQIAEKPASSAIFADSPLCASQTNSSSADESRFLNRVVFFNGMIAFDVAACGVVAVDCFTAASVIVHAHDPAVVASVLLSAHDLAEIHAHHAVRGVEVRIVVGDHDDRLSALSHSGEDLA